jgi:hypothetical protein
MDRVDRGLLLVGVGIALFAVTIGFSAATAPSLQTGVGNESGTLVGSQAWGVAWHEKGRVYAMNGSEVGWYVDDADSYFDVELADDGTIVAAFADGDRSDCGPYSAPCTRTGFQRIDPESREVVGEFSLPARWMTNTETHAAAPMYHGRVAVADMDRERLLVVDQGEVTWEWKASSFYTPPEDPTRRDWLHMNDVDYIGEGRFLVSIRNANQLLVIERGEGVVEVINEDRSDDNDESCLQDGQLVPDADGDVRCGDPAVINHQHNPQWLGDGAVLVADSENDRVVELHRTANDTWQPAWTLSKAGGVGFHWPRDADRLPNGNTLITDTHNGRLIEVNESGAINWSTSTARTPYEADRMPVGEPVGAPRYGDVDNVKDPNSKIPILSTLALGAHAVVPTLPFWVGELEVLVTLVSLVLVLVGAVDWYRR